jgi:hypothetical protein
MFVVYNKETTMLFGKKSYKTRAAARSAITRNGLGETHEVAEQGLFYSMIEKKVTRRNMMSGNEYEEGINTPNYMSPASEAYWSM